MSSGDDSCTDDLSDIDIWKISRNKEDRSSDTLSSGDISSERKIHSEHISAHTEKFESLKAKSKIIQERSRLCREKTEKRRSEKLIRKATRDPLIRKLIEDENADIANDCVPESSKEGKWQDIKPFLTVNDHLQGPVSHGDFGPKTELESLVDEAIEDGDFTKAEVLSDTLANRQFAVKISQAFKAKRYAEKVAIEEEEKKAKRLKKLPWGFEAKEQEKVQEKGNNFKKFEAKERWQMKGNM